MSSEAIAAKVVVVGGLKMRILEKGSYRGGQPRRRKLIGSGKDPKGCVGGGNDQENGLAGGCCISAGAEVGPGSIAGRDGTSSVGSADWQLISGHPKWRWH